MLIRAKDDRQITGTFIIRMTGRILPIKTICEGKTYRCLSNFEFPSEFNLTFWDNHWSNTNKSIDISIFKKNERKTKHPKD